MSQAPGSSAWSGLQPTVLFAVQLSLISAVFCLFSNSLCTCAFKFSPGRRDACARLILSVSRIGFIPLWESHRLITGPDTVTWQYHVAVVSQPEFGLGLCLSQPTDAELGRGDFLTDIQGVHYSIKEWLVNKIFLFYFSVKKIYMWFKSIVKK